MTIYLYRSAVSVNELSPRVPVEVTPIAVTSEADPLEEPPVVLQEKQTGKHSCDFITVLNYGETRSLQLNIEVIPKSSQFPKSHPNPEIVIPIPKELSQTHSKFQSDQKVIPKTSQSHTKVTSKSPQSHHKVFTKSSQNTS